VAAAEEREEAYEVEQRADHGARFSVDQKRRSTAWHRDGVLAKDRLAIESPRRRVPVFSGVTPRPTFKPERNRLIQRHRR
jgi:hypothetical protein